MLVLTRKVEEWIQVGAARVRILAVERGRVKVGVEAGREIEIVRGELLADALPSGAEDLAVA